MKKRKKGIMYVVIGLVVMLLVACSPKDLDKVDDGIKVEKVMKYLEKKEKEGVFKGEPLHTVFGKQDKTHLLEDMYALEGSVYMDYMYAMSSGYLDEQEYIRTYNNLTYEIKTVQDSIEVFWQIETMEREQGVTNRGLQYLYGSLLMETAEKYLEEFRTRERKTVIEAVLRDNLANEYNVAIKEVRYYLDKLNSGEAEKNSLVTTRRGQSMYVGAYFDYIRTSVKILDVLNNIALNKLEIKEDDYIISKSKNIEGVEVKSNSKTTEGYKVIHSYLESNIDLATDVQIGREVILLNIYDLYREYGDSWYTKYNERYIENEDKLMELLVNLDKSEFSNEEKGSVSKLIVKYYTNNVNLSKEIKELMRMGLEGTIDKEKIQKIYVLNLENNKMRKELEIIKKSLAD